MERTYRIQIASEMTGVSEGLIRAWERRYGVLKPKRTTSGYRAYTQSDIEVLRRLKKLTEEGVSIAEAVRLLPQIKREAKERIEEQEQPARAPRAEQYAGWLQGALDAADRLDQQDVERVLDEALNSLPPLAFFEDVVAPLQREIGKRWHARRIGVAEEHLVTQAVRQRVVLLLHQAPRRARAHVVCACLPGEDHELGLMGVALRFRHAGWRVTFLGGKTPAEHLARVAVALNPDLIAISATADLGELAYRRVMTEVMSALPVKSKVIVGGPGAEPWAATTKSLGAVPIDGATTWDPDQFID